MNKSRGTQLTRTEINYRKASSEEKFLRTFPTLNYNLLEYISRKEPALDGVSYYRYPLEVNYRYFCCDFDKNWTVVSNNEAHRILRI